MLQDIRESLCSSSVVLPVSVIKMELYTDSMVCLHWLHKYATTFEKLQKLSVFSTNRLRNIDESCRKFPVTFKHIKGELNPGDYVTKPFSYRRLSPDYYTGPQFLKEPPCKDQSDLVVTIPNPDTAPVDEVPAFEFSPPASLELVSNTRESPMADLGEANKTEIVTSQVSQIRNVQIKWTTKLKVILFHLINTVAFLSW